MTLSPDLHFTGRSLADHCVTARHRSRQMSALKPPAQGIFIPKIVSKPLKPGYGIKIGIFAGIHGDEEAGTLATQELIRWAAEKPEELQDYELHFYPICNPSGRNLGTRHSHSGLDLNREFWFGSIEPEVVYLEGELRRERYDGIISLHSDDTSDGCYGFVSGASPQVSERSMARSICLMPCHPGRAGDT